MYCCGSQVHADLAEAYEAARVWLVLVGFWLGWAWFWVGAGLVLLDSGWGGGSCGLGEVLVGVVGQS